MTGQRILTAAILIPLVVWAVLRAPDWLIYFLVLVITLVALHEFFGLAAKAGAPGHARFTMICVACWLGFYFLQGRDYPYFAQADIYEQLLIDSVILTFNPLSVFFWFVLGCTVLTLHSSDPIPDRFRALGTSSAALLFIFLPMSSLIALHNEYYGPRLLLFVLVLVWVGDTFAYFVGKNFGRHPVAPLLSPQKTWEGSLANLAGSVLVALIFSKTTQIPLRDLAPAAVLGNVAGQIGDLMESVYKRAAGAKDSGTLLPGHGGVLDRIDSLIFAAPVVWYYFSVVIQSRS